MNKYRMRSGEFKSDYHKQLAPMKALLSSIILCFVISGIGRLLGVAKELPTTSKAQVVPEPTLTVTPSPTQTPAPKKARVSAYSCGGLKTQAEIKMNCPSLLRGEPKTATGTTPMANRTVACDKANLGRIFEIEGIGQVVCEDVGGGITGSGRFDLYLATVQEARQFGVQELAYREVK